VINVRTAVATLAVAAVTLLAGCSSSDDTPSTGASASVETTVVDPWDDIDAVADTMTALLNAGCGAAPKPTCEQSGDQLKGFARRLRQLMIDSGEVEYYREGKLIADRVINASSSESLRAAAIELLAWLQEHPA
jgi:hypothetical protein